MSGVRIVVVAATLGALLALHGVQAQVTIFTGAGNWNDTARWSGGAVPGDGEDVIVAGAVTLTNATAALNTYVLNAGYTHAFMGTASVLRAGAIDLVEVLDVAIHPEARIVQLQKRKIGRRSCDPAAQRRPPRQIGAPCRLDTRQDVATIFVRQQRCERRCRIVAVEQMQIQIAPGESRRAERRRLRQG